jgi:hypothetical protein
MSSVVAYNVAQENMENGSTVLHPLMLMMDKTFLGVNQYIVSTNIYQPGNTRYRCNSV